jgi:hypothetical protein
VLLGGVGLFGSVDHDFEAAVDLIVEGAAGVSLASVSRAYGVDNCIDGSFHWYARFNEASSHLV